MEIALLLIGFRANKEGGENLPFLPFSPGSCDYSSSQSFQDELVFLFLFCSPTLIPSSASLTHWLPPVRLFRSPSYLCLSPSNFLHCAIRKKQLEESPSFSLPANPSFRLSKYGDNEMLNLHFDRLLVTVSCQCGTQTCELISESV